MGQNLESGSFDNATFRSVRRIGAAALIAATVPAALRLLSHINTDTGTNTDRKHQIAEMIAAEQPGEVRGFLREYVNFLNPNDAVVIPKQVDMEPSGFSAFSQESLIYANGETQPNPTSTFRSNYDENGVNRSFEFRTDRAEVNSPVINSTINEVIATKGLGSPELADLYEQLLRTTFRLPTGIICTTNMINTSMGGTIPLQDVLLRSCALQGDGRDISAHVSQGEMGLFSSNPKFRGCGV